MNSGPVASLFVPGRSNIMFRTKNKPELVWVYPIKRNLRNSQAMEIPELLRVYVLQMGAVKRHFIFKYDNP